MDMLMDDIAGIWPSGRLPHHDLVLRRGRRCHIRGQSSNKRQDPPERHADIELVTRMHCRSGRTELTTAP